MAREIRFRAWSDSGKLYKDVAPHDNREAIIKTPFCAWSSFYADSIEQYTGLKDKNGDKEIYEYDIIDGEGNIIGNYHETPELLKDRTNLLIQGFGTKTWLTTYQEAMERGCHDA